MPVSPFFPVNPRSLPASHMLNLEVAWTGAFGVKGFLTERFFVRPEMRLLVGSAPSGLGFEAPISNLRFTFGGGYRW